MNSWIFFGGKSKQVSLSPARYGVFLLLRSWKTLTVHCRGNYRTSKCIIKLGFFPNILTVCTF